MDLIENIKVFRRVAELQSFSSAALEMNTTQSTISRTIAALEDSLGVLLFRRSTRRIQLTNEGQKLMQSSAELLMKVDDIVSSLRGEKQSLRGQLRVACSFAIGRTVLIDLIDQFSKAHPDLSFHFRLSDGYVDLIEENIDVAIRMGHLTDSSLRASRIGTARLKLFASKEYLKRAGVPKRIEDLTEHRLISFSRWSRAPRWVLCNNKKENFDFTFKPYFEADGVDMVREAVVKGVGIALLPTWMFRDEEPKGLVVRILDRNVIDQSPIHAVTTSRRDDSSRQRAFIDFIRREFDRIPTLSLRD